MQVRLWLNYCQFVGGREACGSQGVRGTQSLYLYPPGATRHANPSTYYTVKRSGKYRYQAHNYFDFVHNVVTGIDVEAYCAPPAFGKVMSEVWWNTWDAKNSVWDGPKDSANDYDPLLLGSPSWRAFSPRRAQKNPLAWGKRLCDPRNGALIA